LKLICIGDVALANDKLCRSNWMPPGSATVGDEVKVLFNWELPIGTTINSVPRSSGPRLLACPDSTNVIRRWSPGFAALANNHILDAGAEALVNTIGSLNRAGFTTVGAGRTQEEIERPLFWETAEGRLAVVNWVFPETHPDWMSVPGPNCWPGRKNAKNLIQQLKSQTDWVMVVVHWSDEFFPYPRPEDRAIAGELSRMGVDLVVGHHPHVVRGMEEIDSCLVFYSLGNFYFSDIKDGHGGWITREAPRNREGLGVQVSFRRGERPEYRILSFWETKREATLDPFRRAAKRMERVNRPLRRLQDSEYTEWYTIQRARFNRWGYRWHFRLWQIGKGDAKCIYLKLVRHFWKLTCMPSNFSK